MVDYNTRQRRRNMIVGGFVLIAFCCFIWLVFIFGELPVAVSRFRSFRVLVNFPNAPGVQENTPVKYCGYQIGRVIGISPPFLFTEPETGRRYHQVKVTLAIDRKFTTIPVNADVLLMRRGLGSAFIEFEFDPDQQIAGFLKDEDVLQGEMGTSSEFFPKEVQAKIEDLVDAVGSLAESANAIIGDADNQVNIKAAVANVKTATEEAAETLRSFRGLSERGGARMDETATKANEALEALKTLADTGTARVDDVGEQLAATIADIRRITLKINEGEGSAGKLVNDGRLYENLLDSSQELELALEQLKKLVAEAREDGLRIKWW
ncbi:MAG: MCE family protein [Phycisphaerae bacterium]|nr:MCE family protein [Phycisphaerae bacterium]